MLHEEAAAHRQGQAEDHSPRDFHGDCLGETFDISYYWIVAELLKFVLLFVLRPVDLAHANPS